MTDKTTDAGPRGMWFNAGLPVLGVVLALSLWWLITFAFGIESFWLPAPQDVVEAFQRLPGHLIEQAGVTLMTTAIGFAIGAIGGAAVAVLFAASRTVERMTMPLIAAVNAVPKAALAPLLIVWIGLNTQAKIVMVVLLCFFPVLVSTMAGLTSVPNDLRELSHSLSASWWQTFVKVRITWALPQIFVGLKVASSLAIIGAVIAELTNPANGLGSVVVSSSQSADTPLAFAALTLLALMGAGLFYLIVALERMLLPWARATSS
ncbi:ABC transporter permease [Plantactinospora soyae]|uniref:NitT/TauT family transport system permease protein n=1 Tax=Plantactinospora soyae TaxID=1544732 RepID=A0A927MF12_9ACTN|nr:ABC transporter permease [Plantactinospora soyae]MBE1491876.1 NitT/TauT family transport system permease protein [Plantactinospora soyae]